MSRIALKANLAILSMFALTSTARADDQLSPETCKSVAQYCVQSYAQLGYATPNQCFDTQTNNNCPDPGDTPSDPANRIWMWYEGPVCMIWAGQSGCGVSPDMPW